ncbi:MAG: N-acetylmuramoyl-L-alanine amidase [Polyangiaceae bacterium]|nr:N-acetylmuramoyl-L-alanine amidase [Polyangiaceae bacterium]
MSKMTAQVAAINNDCAAASKDPLSAKKDCRKTKWVVVIDPGHGGTANVSGSYWNNAVGVVSDVYEKTMTQRFANILKPTIEARANAMAVDVEVVLTKSDENINLTAAERAQVVTDSKADFFIILHFNAFNRGAESFFLDITPGINGQKRNKPPHYNRQLYSSSDKLPRGPLLVKRADMPSGNGYTTSDAFGASVKSKVLAALKRLDSTSSFAPRHDQLAKGNNVPLLKQGLYGKHQFACCYLEGDFINVESGDRTWNPIEYAANIGEVRGDKVSVDAKGIGAAIGAASTAPFGASLGPLGLLATAAGGAAAGNAMGAAINALQDPPLLAKDEMYKAASEAITDAIFEVIARVILEQLSKDAQKLWKQVEDGWKKLSEPAKE